MHSRQILERLSKRVLGISTRYTNRRVPPVILGATLLIAALVFGIWAQDLAEASALSGWLRLHPPSEKMWKHALLAHGLQEVGPSKNFQKISKTLPSLSDENGKTWVSDHAGWIALYNRAENGPSLALYCWDCERPPTGWEPLGNGWEAFDPAMARLEAALAARKPISQKHTVAARDPREIYY